MLLEKSKVENSILVQDNKIINAKFGMSKHEQRIFLFMLASIDKKDKNFKEVIIPVDLLEIYHLSNNFVYIKKECEELLKKTIGIQTEIDKGKDKGKKKWVGYSLFASCEYIEGYAHIKAQFNEKIKPLLLNLTENFTSAEFKRIAKLENFYTYRIYWLIKQYEKIGKRVIEYNHLKDMLNVEDKYKRFVDFKRRILNPAQQQLENTEVAFNFKPIRAGKKSIKSIEFKLKKFNNPQLELEYQTKIKPKPTKTSQAQINPVPTMTLHEKFTKVYKLQPDQVAEIAEKLEEKMIRRIAYKIDTDNAQDQAYEYFKSNFNQ